MTQPSLSDYRKMLARHKSGHISGNHLAAVFDDLLDRLFVAHEIDPEYPHFIEALGNPKPAKRLTYNQWVELEAGLQAGIQQDFINEQEGNP